jgi:hypothetical protein
MEDDVGFDGVCFAGAGEVAGLDVGSKTLFGCFSGDGDLLLLVFCRRSMVTAVAQALPRRNGETHLPISGRIDLPFRPSWDGQDRCRPGTKLRWRAGQQASRLYLRRMGFGRLRFLQ